MTDSSINWTYGIGYSIVASVIGGASKLAIRKSYLMLEEDDTTHIIDNEGTDIPANYEHRRFRMTVNPHNISMLLRVSGMIGMTVLNPLFCVLAMNYAEPSILAPFSGVTLVWIVVFSDLIIGEKPQSKQVAAAVLVIAGEVIVAIFGDHTNDENVSVEEVISSYENPYFQLYFVSMMLWIGVLLYIVRTKSAAAALTRFAFGVLGGSLTGFQNFLKDSLTIIKAVHSDDGDPTYPWVLYLLLLCAAGSSFVGLLFLTACMKRYDATFSSAMFVGSFVISASIMSAVHYQTFQHLQGIVNWILYPTGILILMIGLGILVNVTHDNDGIVSHTGVSERLERQESSESRYSLMNDISMNHEDDVYSSSPAEII